jgi:hypothetical protein
MDFAQVVEQAATFFSVLECRRVPTNVEPDIAALFRRFGIYAPSDHVITRALQIPQGVNGVNAPTVFAVAFEPTLDDGKSRYSRCTGVMCAASGRTAPLGVEPIPSPGTYYQMVSAYNVNWSKFDAKYKTPVNVWVSCYIHFGDDGAVTPLRETCIRSHSVNGRAGHREWQTRSLAYPHSIQMLVGEVVPDLSGAINRVRESFCATLNYFLTQRDAWQVVIEDRRRYRVRVCIAPNDAPRFFAKREKHPEYLDRNGNRKKILHTVRQHRRVTASGATSVKWHVRGLDDFETHGFRFRVIAPNVSGVSPVDFALRPITISETQPAPKGHIGMVALANLLARSNPRNRQWQKRLTSAA